MLNPDENPDIYLNLEALMRFLRARQFKLEDAVAMWVKWKKWRIENRIDYMVEEDVIKEIKTGKVFVSGYDNER